MEFDTVIVGSGAAGVAAAMELDRLGTAIIDVGNVSSQPFGWNSLRDAKQAGDVKQLLGSHWEMLANIDVPKIHSKLRAAQMRYVDSGVPFSVVAGNSDIVNAGRGSYARGGFANAWGAQVYRYTQSDIDALENWPIEISELEPHYDKLEMHMGVAGLSDDLDSFFGSSKHLLPPLPLTASASRLLSLYQKNRLKINRFGLTLGHPRLAVLTAKYRGYSAHEYGETEFFDTMNPAIYTPQRTLDELIARGNITYLSQLRLDSYKEVADGVELVMSNVSSGENVHFKARRVLLACGALHTARLVLLNNGCVNRSLPVLEHPPALLPVIMPRSLAKPLATKSFPIQLAGCFDYHGEKQMVSVYYAGGMLRSDLLFDFPFSLNDNLWLLNNILPGLFVLQIWRPSLPHPRNRFRLDDAGEIVLEYPIRPSNVGIESLLNAMRVMGVYGHKHFTQESPVGWGFHFAGSLPMSHRPNEFETNEYCQLWNCKRVYVIDGAVLPSLPAKNLTLTIMANAARIAAHLSKC